ncbi:hypothetical protein BDM02DRAFT_3124820 [Thelephora ganbajun]|uniref:Uncharacterized protein n=1 Tax=Thelephora ganbajun TaxID=370292 RepID=A0ACB6YZ29_THEGA|nr:hypothetical protein BDM02DRAFT_3124820 [Thelephora ganbajun]
MTTRSPTRPQSVHGSHICVCGDYRGREILEVWCWPSIRKHAGKKRRREVNVIVKFKLSISVHSTSVLIQIVLVFARIFRDVDSPYDTRRKCFYALV